MTLRVEEQDKTWLKQQASSRRVSVAEMVRAAIRDQRAEEESFDSLLSETRGIWRKGEGLKYQRRIRSEWNRCARA